jgi:CubicO group peptidase (beta-lactamase class C family)
MLLHLHTMPPRFVAALLNPRSLSARSGEIPGLSVLDDFNREALREVEMPSSNGTGTARSVARLYGSAATGGTDIGLNPSTFEALAQPAIPPTSGSRDKVLQADAAYSLGFMKPVPKFVFGSSEKAFGTPGLGGSFAFADPETGTGFAYAMNRLGFHFVSDPRELSLRHTLFHDILGARPQK